jgi:hypothetical protein
MDPTSRSFLIADRFLVDCSSKPNTNTAFLTEAIALQSMRAE